MWQIWSKVSPQRSDGCLRDGGERIRNDAVSMAAVQGQEGGVECKTFSICSEMKSKAASLLSVEYVPRVDECGNSGNDVARHRGRTEGELWNPRESVKRQNR